MQALVSRYSLRPASVIVFVCLMAVCAHSASTEADRRNVILMVADGIGFNGWLAADYHAGAAGTRSYQRPRPDGTVPYIGASAHYALRLRDASGAVLPNDRVEDAAGVEDQYYDPHHRWDALEGAFHNDFGSVSIPYTSYTDSAAAGTALHTGRKTLPGRINMDWRGETPLETIAHIADRRGLATGAVASVMVSHATPASVWAQVPTRNQYQTIFRQMADGRLDVIMGTGHPYYDTGGHTVEAPADEAFRFLGGRETFERLTGPDGLNGYTFIDSVESFRQLARSKHPPERVIGIARTLGATQATRTDFASNPDKPSGMASNPDVPDLATMSLAALNVLSRNEKGFFVMIEGGAADWMGHANNMPRFIEEQNDFNHAIDAVIDWVEEHSSWNETLLIVTSDHETGGIWGEGTFLPASGVLLAESMDREALEASRFDPDRDEFVEFKAVQDRGRGEMPGHQFASGNHTNDLVPLWALGIGSEFLREFERVDSMAAELWGKPYGWDGRYVDNADIFHVMRAAMEGRPSSSVSRPQSDASSP